MRTIKFRGYNPKNKKWIYGHYFVNRGQHFIVQDGLAPPQATWEDYEVEPETIGQYIGLNDKKGTEIYEGDVVRVTNSYMGGRKIVVKEHTVEWNLKSDFFIDIFLYGDKLDIEIVGFFYRDTLTETI